MTIKEVIRSIMDSRGFSNSTLAEKMGYKTPTGISERLRGNMRVDVLLKMLDSMDCELVVRSKLADKSQWVISEGESVQYKKRDE